MRPKYTIAGYREVSTPITQPVTKFGGQPVWLAEPQWPISRSTGNPMRFICQIALDERVFGPLAGRVAYVFMNDNLETDQFVDNTWDPEGGENAVVIQPGGTVDVACNPLRIGPTLFKMVWPEPDQRGQPMAVELEVDLVPADDPDILDAAAAEQESEQALDAFSIHVSEDKIGGTPAFLQYPEYPLGPDARLLLQLNAPANGAFSINLGDAGVAYAFIAADGARGKLLWQCM